MHNIIKLLFVLVLQKKVQLDSKLFSKESAHKFAALGMRVRDTLSVKLTKNRQWYSISKFRYNNCVIHFHKL